MSQDRHEVRYIPARRLRRRPALHVRSRRMTLICLALLAYALVVLLSVSALISGDHWWGLSAQPADAPAGAWRVTWVDTGGLASGISPIQPGDTILSIDGHLPHSEDEINRANTLIFSQNGSQQTLRWQAPGPLDNVLSISWFVLGTVSLLLGLLVFLHATDRTLASRFFLLLIAMALVSALEPAATFGIPLAEHAVASLSTGLFFGLLANFLWLLLFPRTADAKRSAEHRWLPEIPVVTGISVTALYLWSETLKQQDTLNLAAAAAYGQTALAIILSLFFMLRVSFSRRATLARERARTLLGGMLLGLTPLLALSVVPILISGQPILPGQVSALALIALPLSFAYAIVRRDLLRVDSLIRNTALFLLTVIGMSILAALLAAALAQLPTGPALVLGIVAGAVLAPFVLAGARWITEAWLFPQVRRYRSLIKQGENIERTGLDPQRVAGQLISEIHMALPVRQVAVFAPDPQTGRLLAVAAPPAPPKPDEQGAAAPAPKGVVARAPSPPRAASQQEALFIDETLSARLSRDGEPLLVEPDLASIFAPDPNSGGKQQGALPSTNTGPIQTGPTAPDLDSWRLLLPMRVRGRLVALLALSRREDEQDYADTDLRMLRFLAGRRTLALDYALLYADLHTAFEKQQEIDRLKDQFIVTAHHELRTPLTGVQGYLELLRDLGPTGRMLRPDEVTLFIERACEQTEVLTEQLNSLLIAAETMKPDHLKLRPVELSHVAQRAMQSLDALAQRGHHRTRNQIPLDLIVLADEEALYRIFLNLLSNALKYSPEGRPVLFDGRARMPQAPTPAGVGPVAEIIVRDWGVGIPKVDQHKIFERFTRLERDLNSPVRGSGLGLAICKELIEGMGGTIWVESEGVPGMGSSFILRLLLAESSVTSERFAGWEDMPVAP